MKNVIVAYTYRQAAQYARNELGIQAREAVICCTVKDTERLHHYRGDDIALHLLDRWDDGHAAIDIITVIKSYGLCAGETSTRQMVERGDRVREQAQETREQHA